MAKKTKKSKKKAPAKKASKKKADEYPKLVFEKKYGDTHEVYIKTGPEAFAKKLLCHVSLYNFRADAEPYWAIRHTYGGADFVEDLPPIKFKTKEEAAELCWTVFKNVKSVTESRPLPDDVKEYVERRARSLRDKQRELESAMYDLRTEQAELKQLAEKNRIDRAIHFVDVTTGEEALKELLELGFNDGPGEESLIDFIYKQFGKDAGRSYRGRLTRLVRALDPSLPEKVSI